MVSPPRVVGIVGIGQLGLPVATNLMAAGFDVVGYRRTAPEEFIHRGGRALESAKAVAREANVVLLCLPSEDACLQALHGPAGVLNGIKSGQIVIELSTYRQAFKIQQAEAIHAAGGQVLEAEVSGSPALVLQRKAACYLGGSEALVQECMPVLQGITDRHFHIGEFGSAVKMKLIANYLLTIHTLAAAEAMNLATRAGFKPQQVAEVISQGAGSSAMFVVRAPMMASRSFSPAPGPFHTLEKYLELGSELVEQCDAAAPLFSAATPYFTRAIETGIGAEDISAVIKLLEEDSGKTASVKDQK